MGKKKKHNLNKKSQPKVVVPPPPSVDLHVHTMHSLDGGFSVAKILSHALSNNVKHLSITDHNSINGLKKALRIIEAEPEKYKSLNLISGVEISCVDKELGAKFHLLVYGFDPNNKELNEKLEQIRRSERERYYNLFSILENELGIKFSPYEIVKASATNSDITLDVIAKMAVLHIDENGKPAPYASTPEEFKEYVKKVLGANKHFAKIKNKLMIDLDRKRIDDFDKTPYPSLEDILPIIKAAGGIPVIAHPTLIHCMDESENNRISGTPNLAVDAESPVLTDEQLAEQKKLLKAEAIKKTEDFIKAFKNKTHSFGLEAGIEAFFGAQKGKENYFINIAKKNNLIIAGGSDFHGPHKNFSHRIGAVASRYYLTDLPIIHYLNNGRTKSSIYYPEKASNCYESITSDVKKIYTSKNEKIFDKRRYKMASNIAAVAKQFGGKLMPIHRIEERAIKIKCREELLENLSILKQFCISDKHLLSSAELSELDCKKSIKALQKNYRSYHIHFKNIKNLIERCEQKDNLENKDKFREYVNQSYSLIKKEYRSAMNKRHSVFKQFNINIKSLNKYNKIKNLENTAENNL